MNRSVLTATFAIAGRCIGLLFLVLSLLAVTGCDTAGLPTDGLELPVIYAGEDLESGLEGLRRTYDGVLANRHLWDH